MKTQAILVSLLIALGCTAARAAEQVARVKGTAPGATAESGKVVYDVYDPNWKNWDLVAQNIPSVAVTTKTDQSMLLPEGVSFADLDEPAKKKYSELILQYFEYQVSGYQHREKVFAWQHCSSQIIFAVVIILVFTAIYFSWLQFRQSLEPGRSKAPKQARQSAAATKGTDDIAARDVGATQLEASVKGIKISSPILGVVILVISLLFFYLYLVHVYPITEIS